MLHRLFTVSILSVLLAFLGCEVSAQSTVLLAFLKGQDMYIVQRQVNDQPTPELAASLLLSGPTPDESAMGIRSAVPKGTQLLSASVDVNYRVHLDLSKDYLADGSSDAQVEAMGRQWFGTFGQFPFVAGVVITVEGKPLTDFLKPAVLLERSPEAAPQAAQTAGVLGKKIALSPGHGRFWNGSGWYYQRGTDCGYENEDLRDLKMMIYLQKYLLNHGAMVKMARQTDLNGGNSPYDGNRAWWQMASNYWLKSQGYPSSVYASYTGDPNLGTGANESSDDIRARPLMSDYENTDIYVSVHTNGWQGGCTGAGCPTGTETYYDASTEHATWGDISMQLANAVNPNIVSSINIALPETSPDWGCHGTCVKDSNGNYGEIRIPDRAAILTEIGFHDTCDRDALYLNDNFFRSVAMWGIYKGICQYFGDTPTPMYSAQYVSDDIPTLVNQNDVKTVHITFRNKGVVWSEGRAFRLGAVDDSDPFAGTRQTMTGEAGPNDTYTFTFTMNFPQAGTFTTDWQMVRDGFGWFGDKLTKQVVVQPSTPDTEPPTVPGNAFAEATDYSVVHISWNASTDNTGVSSYEVWRGGVPLATVPSSQTTYDDTGLTQTTDYTYQVRAKDYSNNYSVLSDPSTTRTWTIIMQDGFEDLSRWTPGKVADGSYRGLSLDSSVGCNIPGGSGAPAARADIGSSSTNGSFSYVGFPASFAVGYIECSFMDSAASNNSRQGMAFRKFKNDDPGQPRLVYYIGLDSTVGYSGYDCEAYSPSIGWARHMDTCGPRSVGWHRFRVTIDGTKAKFYTDGVYKDSISEPAESVEGCNRFYLGYNYNVNQTGWYDDFLACCPTPPTPTASPASAIGVNTVTWNYTEGRSDWEQGFYVKDISCNVKATGTRNSTSAVESGLAANTLCVRKIMAYNGILESDTSAEVSAVTLSVPPSTSNIQASPGVGAWSSGSFTFTSLTPFGPGGVQYYRYAFDQSSTHTWTDSEPAWNGGTLQVSAPASGNGWYMHLKGFNSADVPNGTLDLGPFNVDTTAPAGLVCADSGPYTMSTSRLKATLSGATDLESGVAGYRVGVGSTSGATDVTGGWVDVATNTSPTISGLNLTVGNTYWVSAQAKNAAGLWGNTATADGISVIAPIGTIADALAAAPGTLVGLQGKVVTIASPSDAYIEEIDRFAALHVIGSDLTYGYKYDLIGTMGAAVAPRAFYLICVDDENSGVLPAPVFMRLSNLGGADFGPYSPGAPSGVGLYNFGMLVRVCGTVTSWGEGYFVIDDGSLPGGLKVQSGSLHKPAVGTLATVTGVSTIIPGSYFTTVIPGADWDIVP